MNKIKLIKTSSYYKYYIVNLYQAEKKLKDASYDEQYKRIMSDCYGWSDFWKSHLEATDNFEVREIIFNNEIMQKQWAKEHNISYNKSNWQEVILEAQLAEYKPDIWFSHGDISSQSRLRLRKNTPSLKYVLGYDGTGKHQSEFFLGCDIMLSCFHHTLDYYKEHGYKVYFLPYAFEKKILNKIKQRELKYDVSFVGSFYPFKGLHSQRLKLITDLTKKVHIDIWSPSILRKGLVNSLWSLSKLVRNGQWKDIYYSSYIDNISNNSIYGLDMYQVLADSKITINTHGDLQLKKGGNMRLFEATGTGTCLLTDWKENISDFFEPEKEIVTYKSFDECLEKIKYLLSHEDERKAIAAAGQQRTLTEHSYDNVFSQFLCYLEEVMK
ncbi:MAG: glycosyltransferase [Ignavibacteria bacterium]